MGGSREIIKYQQILVSLMMLLAIVEISQSCHRRVEYHYPKKHPPPHHHHHGGHQHHGHNQHKGGGHHHGHHGHHHKGYHGGGDYGGGGHGHGHGDGGYDEGGHGGYGGHHGQSHGHKDHDHDDGYGYGGGGYDGGHKEGHGGGGYDGGHKGHGHGMKGRKYQMYESMHYNDKGKHHQPQSHHGYYHPSSSYHQDTPNYHYMQKGYGKSGPYRNVQYSTSNVVASVNTPYLPAADTADLIRSGYNSKQNEIMPHPTGTFGTDDDNDNLGDYTTSDGNNIPNRPAVVKYVEPQVVHVDQIGNNIVGPTRATKQDQTRGNFDLNLNYNSDLPPPFRRDNFDSNRNANGRRKRKRISSKYRRRHESVEKETDDEPTVTHEVASAATPPRQIIVQKGGSDYLEIDPHEEDDIEEAVPTTLKPATNFDFMNF